MESALVFSDLDALCDTFGRKEEHVASTQAILFLDLIVTGLQLVLIPSWAGKFIATLALLDLTSPH